MPWEFKIFAPDVSKFFRKCIDPQHIAAMGQELGRLIVYRVKTQHTDAEGRPLPPYTGRVWTPREAFTRAKLVKGETYQRKHETWDEASQGPPPEVFQQLRKLGGVFLLADSCPPGWTPPNGTPIRYLPAEGMEVACRHPRTGEMTTRRAYPLIPEKAGKVYAWHYPNRAAMQADLYGGPAVDYFRSGQMFRSLQVRVAWKRGGPVAILRFAGTNVAGKNPREVARQQRKKRRVTGAAKAYLTRARGADGKLDGSIAGSRDWFNATPAQIESLLNTWAKIIKGEWTRLPRVEVKPARTPRATSGTT